MRLRAFLEGLVGYQGDSRAKGDYADSESAAMKKERETRKPSNTGNVADNYASKMSVEQMQDEIKDAEDMLDASETSDQMDRYKEKIKALQAAIKIKKQKERSKE